MDLPKKLQLKLEKRLRNNTFRKLPKKKKEIDFSSNDYLGFAKCKKLYYRTHNWITTSPYLNNGATGSRLLSGNSLLHEKIETEIAKYHQVATGLLFNSGYDANLGLCAAVFQREDIVLYDEQSHASIRDGIQLSRAKAYKFKHNHLGDLEKKLMRLTSQKKENQNIYILTESVFSMTGDSPDVAHLVQLCDRYQGRLIVDEAHALGVTKSNLGLLRDLGLHQRVFATVITFSKALGCHGAIVLGSASLKNYLINFARSFIYTTALPPFALANIKIAYKTLFEEEHKLALQQNIVYFKSLVLSLNLQDIFVDSDSAIQNAIIPGNIRVKQISNLLGKYGYDVKPILAPTVAVGEERLRFCLHSYNRKENIKEVLVLLKKTQETLV